MNRRFQRGVAARKSLEGHLLVASPHRRGGRFARTVVLLLRHDDRGALGLVLNRPVDDEKIERLWRQLGRGRSPLDYHFSCGGPVAGPLVALQEARPVGQRGSLAGMGAAAEGDLASPDRQACRVFIGHAGWRRGQLEKELKVGAWMTMPATRDHIFGDHDDLWVTAVKEIGRSVMKSAVNVKHAPGDPSWN